MRHLSKIKQDTITSQIKTKFPDFNIKRQVLLTVVNPNSIDMGFTCNNIYDRLGVLVSEVLNLHHMTP